MNANSSSQPVVVNNQTVNEKPSLNLIKTNCAMVADNSRREHHHQRYYQMVKKNVVHKVKRPLPEINGTRYYINTHTHRIVKQASLFPTLPALWSPPAKNTDSYSCESLTHPLSISPSRIDTECIPGKQIVITTDILHTPSKKTRKSYTQAVL